MNETKSMDEKQPKELQGNAGDDGGRGESADEVVRLRDQRLEQYLRAALQMEDPLVANVSALNADLLQLAKHMTQRIVSAYEELSPNVGEFIHLAPATDAYLRLTRQIERFSTLVDRINGRQGRADNTAPVSTGGDVAKGIQEPDQGELVRQ